jgi:agmatinase
VILWEAEPVPFLTPDGPDRWPALTYAGVMSFGRAPFSRDLTDADIAILGVPLDLATTGRSGAREGPNAIRTESAKLSELPNFPYGFDPVERGRIVDCGDVAFDTNRSETVVPTVEGCATEILSTGTRLLSLGGDHFISYPLLRAHRTHHGEPLALLHFDAHTDTWPDDGERLDHGSMFRRAVNDELIDPDTTIQVGVRTWNDDSMGLESVDAPWLHEHGLDATFDRITRRVGDRRCYATFDVDCLDPAFAPGTGTPVAGGLSTAQALGLWRRCADRLNIVGADIVEVSPPFDVAGITALAAATLAHDLLSAWTAEAVG